MFKKPFIVLNTVLLLGCNTMLLGSYGEDNQTLEAFTQRVENVFKFQNSMTNAVMLMEDDAPVAILESEQKMHIACKPLNDYASREMEGLSSDFALQNRVEQTAIGCEKAALELQTVLSGTQHSK